MPTVEERVSELEGRVKKMDGDLKHHFTEFRAFVVETLDGVEQRLSASIGARIDKVDAKLDMLLSRVQQRTRTIRRRKRR